MTPHPAPPWRIRGVEHLPVTDLASRRAALESAGSNLFLLPASQVGIDLLTDSGTGAMSQAQWAALLQGDEAYAGSRSSRHLEEVVESLFGFAGVFPVHQGRAAENILFRHLLPKGGLVLSNHLFDTTQAHAGAQGFRVAACLGPQGGAFGGDFELASLEAHLATGEVAVVIATVTCNSAGGVPMSLANLSRARSLCDAEGVLLWLDAARIAENSWFQFRAGEGDSPADCARRTADLADGMVMSAKKDGLVNIGGLLAVRDEALRAAMSEDVILYEGYPTYGGMAGRDLDAMAIGLGEALDPRYLAHRVGEVACLQEALTLLGVPCVHPPGGHAVFVDAGAWLPHLAPTDFPGQALAVALYLAAGVRACEVGSLLIGSDPQGRQLTPPGEYLRLAIPRRTYTEGHLRFVAEVFADLASTRESIPPAVLASNPTRMRHFTASFLTSEWTPPQSLSA
ncbi:tryptophanase [bacterium]|nr:tryptophanase [bacterium]